MKKKMSALAVALLAAIASLAFLPNSATELSPGAEAPSFNLKNVDGQMVSFATYPQAKGFIVVFTCNHCPYSIKYEQTIIDMDIKYRPLGYPVIAINPNDAKRVPDDSHDNMVARARERNFPFAYLHDETQATARAYGATKTPHVFVVQREGGKNIVRYVGGINNNANNPAEANRHYVADAISDLMSGRAVRTARSVAMGCSIKWAEGR